MMRRDSQLARVYPAISRPMAGGAARWGAVGLTLMLGLLVAGCRSQPTPKPLDSKIERYASNGQESYSEGFIEDAVGHYRRAVKRAWLLDDPVEVAHAAYNLAACLGSNGQLAEARDWLHEARSEFARAGRSDRNAWLLDAKLAGQMGLYDEAMALTREAEYRVHCTLPSCPPCFDPTEPPPECDPCDKPQRLRDRLTRRKEAQQRQQLFDVQLHLTRAAVAAEAGFFDQATSELNLASRWLADTSDLDARAEYEHLRGVVALYSGQPARAGARFDLEAEVLRAAGNHREISTAVETAANAYEVAGDYARAADRHYRVARIYYARDRHHDALAEIKLAVPLAEISGDLATQARLALLFREVAEAVEAAKPNRAADDGETLPTPSSTTTTAPGSEPTGEPPPSIQPPNLQWK